MASKTNDPKPAGRLRQPQTWWMLWLVLAVVGFGYTVASREGRTTTAIETALPRPGFAAPDFALTTLEGETLRLSEQRGRPVVLNFWASWCGPCRIETPYFQAIHAQFGDDLVMLGVNQAESAETAAQFASEFQLTYPLLLDTTGQVNRLYRVSGLPTTLLIDADGTIRQVIPGAINETALRAAVDTLLADAPGS